MAAMEPASELDRRRLDITREMIDGTMITYPPLVRFTEIEDAAWRALQAALLGRRSPGEAARAIQKPPTASCCEHFRETIRATTAIAGSHPSSGVRSPWTCA
jgi:hypothetical protein